MTTLEELLERLSELGPGHSGRVTTAELMEIAVPGIPDYEHKRRAEWLRDQLPFPCSFQEGTTGVVFKRAAFDR